MKDLCLKYILSGGPSCGKTTVLEALQQRRFLTFVEQAREVIKSSLSQNSKALPWEDANAFSDLVCQEMAFHFDQHLSHTGIAFTDRSMIDLNAYLRENTLPENEYYYNKAKSYCFAKTVFFFPIWQEIFDQDNERIEDLSKAIAITNSLRDTYLKQGYILVEVPLLSVNERVSYILDYIKRHPHV